MNKIIELEINQLEFWGENPRYGLNAHHNDASSAIKALFQLNETKMYNLGEDISRIGLIGSDLPIVMKTKRGKYRVYEGNRRIANLYCLTNPSIIDFNERLKLKYELLSKDFHIGKISCYLTDDLELVYNMIERIHNGEKNGVGRSSWGTTENNILKEIRLKYKTIDTTDTVMNNEEFSPHYVLLSKYPHTFESLVDRLKPTNIDRILEKNIFKSAVETSNYADIDYSKLRAIEDTLNWAETLSKDTVGGISRRFNEDQIKNELIPFYKTKIDEYTKVRDIPKLEVSSDHIRITEGQNYDLNPIIVNRQNFADIKYKPSESLILSSSNFIDSNNSAGKYSIIISAKYEGIEVTSPLISITIQKRKEIVIKKSTGIFQHDFSDNFTINVSNSLNEYLDQLKQLDSIKFNFVMNLSLRVLLEESLKVFANYHSFDDSGLEKLLIAFKNYFVNDVITNLSSVSGISYGKIHAVIYMLNPSTLTRSLNPIAHNLVSVHIDDLKGLARVICNILVIITEDLKIPVAVQ